ncbi:hypothetical protein Nmel_001764 [Mimus melanotis]
MPGFSGNPAVVTQHQERNGHFRLNQNFCLAISGAVFCFGIELQAGRAPYATSVSHQLIHLHLSSKEQCPRLETEEFSAHQAQNASTSGQEQYRPERRSALWRLVPSAKHCPAMLALPRPRSSGVEPRGASRPSGVRPVWGWALRPHGAGRGP